MVIVAVKVEIGDLCVVGECCRVDGCACEGPSEFGVGFGFDDGDDPGELIEHGHAEQVLGDGVGIGAEVPNLCRLGLDPEGIVAQSQWGSEAQDRDEEYEQGGER